MSDAGKAIFTGDVSASGDLTVGNIKAELKKTTSTVGDYYGTIITGLGSQSTTKGTVYSWSGTAWLEAAANSGTTGQKFLAVAVADSSTNGMLVNGTVTLDHDPGSNGDVLFLSNTAGEVTGSAPSSTGDVVRIMGYCLDSSNNQIYFNPSPDFIIHA
jgi:hypothetical protein